MNRLPFQCATKYQRYMLAGVSAAVALMFASCARPEPKSAIVEAFEQAGGGPVSPETSTPAIQDWFRKHRQAAESIDAQCKPVRQSASANWGDSTEGRVCQAARTVAASTYKRLESDHQTFSSGWK
jgi:hypothetical protein